MSRFAHRAVPVALAAVVIDTIGFGIVMPVLPRLITTLGHINVEDAARFGGLMLVAFSIAQFLAGPILGNLGDAYGRRPVLFLSMLAFGFDYALMAFAPTLAWLFLGRVVAGIAGGLYSPASAVIADVTPPEKRAEAFGWIGACFGLAFIIGPALGGVIATLGDRAPFFAAAGLALANAAVMYFIMPETHAPENRRPFRLKDAHIVASFGPLFSSKQAAPLLVAMFLYQIGHMVYPATWSFYGVSAFGWSPRAIGYSLAFAGLTMVIVQGGITGKFVARFGERRALAVAMGSAALGFFLFIFVTKGWQVYPIFVIDALSAMGFGASSALLSRLVGADRQGALQGGVASMNSVASIISPIAMTQMLAIGLEHHVTWGAFALAAALSLAATLIVWTRVSDPKPLA